MGIGLAVVSGQPYYAGRAGGGGAARTAGTYLVPPRGRRSRSGGSVSGSFQ
jgi:hypothetical protein